MCFPGPSKNDFLRLRDRFRTPKGPRIEFFGSFLAPPWILRCPQNHLKSAKWHQNGLIKTLPRRSWHQPASKTLPETLPGTILAHVWWIFVRFLGELPGMSPKPLEMISKTICFWTHALPQNVAEHVAKTITLGKPMNTTWTIIKERTQL